MRPRTIVLIVLGVGINVAIVGGILAFAVVKYRKGVEQRELADRNARIEAERLAGMNRGVPGLIGEDPIPPTAEELESFNQVFIDLGIAMRREDAEAVAAAFDIDRFAVEMDLSRAVSVLPGGDTPANRASFIRGMRVGAGRNLLQNESFRWERIDIRRVRWNGNRDEAVLTTILRQEPGNASKMRWWLIRGADGWKIYDFEELDLGLRFSRLITVVATPEVLREYGTTPERLKAALTGIRLAAVALGSHEDIATADMHLQSARGLKLPAPIAAVREFLEGCLLTARGDSAAALRKFDEADRLQPGMPVLLVARASAYMIGGKNEEALRSIRAYLLELGGDADAHVIEGTVLVQLNRHKEAAAAFRKALVAQPDCVAGFEGLRHVLAEDEKPELGTWLGRAPDPGKVYLELIRLARADDDKPAVEALGRSLYAARPNDPNGIIAHMQGLVDSKQYLEAANDVKSALDRVSREDRARVREGYLLAMFIADRIPEAYSSLADADAVVAFRFFAERLEDQAREDDDEKAAKTLSELTAAHRKRVPTDPWAGFYEASQLQTAKEYEKAEAAYAAAQVLYLKSAKQPKKSDKDWEADLFRARRVECLLALKNGPRAFAEVGPVEDTFLQLASAYEGEKDFDSLEEMVEVFREKHPEDRGGKYWAANVHYLRKKYPLAADAFRKYLNDADEKDRHAWSANDRCIRAGIRSDRMRLAQELVAELGPERVGPGLRAAVALACKRPRDAEAILAELAARPQGSYSYLYYDEDFNRLMHLPEHAALLKKYPDTRPKPKGPIE